MFGVVLRKIPRVILYISVRIGWIWPAYIVLKHVIKPACSIQSSRGPTLLALSIERSRGDIDILAGSGCCNLYTLPGDWLFILYSASYGIRKRLISDFFNPGENDRIRSLRRRYRGFLSKLIQKLYSSLNIDGTIGFAVHYRQDFDFGAEGNLLGYPYIVLHRENMFDNKGHQRYIEYKSRVMGRFSGSLIITHNEVTRNAFLSSDYAKPEQVIALGCLRMDPWLKYFREDHEPCNIRNVVMFSFPPGVGLLFPERIDTGENKNWPISREDGYYNLFCSVHWILADLAKIMPDVNFIIKTKGGGRYVAEIRKSCLTKGLIIDDILNLKVTDTVSTHELIRNASVVVAFGSTVLLESGAIGKPTIMPYYEEAKSERWADYLHFSEDLDAFFLANSEAELRSLILEKLASPVVTSDKVTRCRHLFEKYVSPLSGSAVQRYGDAINLCLNRDNHSFRVVGLQ